MNLSWAEEQMNPWQFSAQSASRNKTQGSIFQTEFCLCKCYIIRLCLQTQTTPMGVVGMWDIYLLVMFLKDLWVLLKQHITA